MRYAMEDVEFLIDSDHGDSYQEYDCEMCDECEQEYDENDECGCYDN